MFRIVIRLILFLSFVSAIGLWTGCDEDGEVAAAADKSKDTKPASSETPKKDDKEKIDEVFSYSAIDRRDPFKSYYAELSGDEVELGDLSELQKIELNKFRLVAVVTGTATPMAMVQDPAGKGYTVRIGTRIGKQLGQVKQIRREEIVIQEEFRDFTGKIIPVYKPLKLAKGSR